MAEGFLRQEVGEIVSVFSAGSKPTGYVHPLAIKVMAAAGVDISNHWSKHLSDFLERRVDIVIVVCEETEEACPRFKTQSVRFHWRFDDPAKATGSEEQILCEFERVRDEIKQKLLAYAEDIKGGKMFGSAQVY